jgi:DUF438 domain-containing protein
LSGSVDDRKRMLKEMIKQLHDGAPPEQVKEKFKHVVEGTSAGEISRIEQELVKEGMPREELQRLCSVHLAVFAEQLQEDEIHLPPGHPISILIEEHRVLLQRAERLDVLVGMIEEACDMVYVGDALTELQSIAKEFVEAEKHYQREENVLFPTLEKHGISEPPRIMWMEHDRIREVKKGFRNLVENWNSMKYTDFKEQLSKTAKPLCSLLPDHFFKENNIIFPTALQEITNKEWTDVRKEFDEIGYCSFTPSQVIVAMPATTAEKPKTEAALAGTFQFETGSLSNE